MIFLVEVLPKKGIFDPQGRAVKDALHQLGFERVQNCKVGKLIRVDLECSSRDEGEIEVKSMAEKLLANPNVETYRILPGAGDDS